MICVQFDPKQQDLVSHDLPYSKGFSFFRHSIIMEHNRHINKSSITQFSQKILFSNERTIWAQFGLELINLISIIYHRVSFSTILVHSVQKVWSPIYRHPPPHPHPWLYGHPSILSFFWTPDFGKNFLTISPQWNTRWTQKQFHVAKFFLLF